MIKFDESFVLMAPNATVAGYSGPWVQALVNAHYTRNENSELVRQAAADDAAGWRKSSEEWQRRALDAEKTVAVILRPSTFAEEKAKTPVTQTYLIQRNVITGEWRFAYPDGAFEATTEEEVCNRVGEQGWITEMPVPNS